MTETLFLGCRLVRVLAWKMECVLRTLFSVYIQGYKTSAKNNLNNRNIIEPSVYL